MLLSHEAGVFKLSMKRESQCHSCQAHWIPLAEVSGNVFAVVAPTNKSNSKMLNKNISAGLPLD